MPDDRRPKDLIDWLGLRSAPDWAVARPLGPLLAVALSILFVLALIAAFVGVGRAILATEVGLGTGGLLVALLGAPFLIWTTWLKHRTVEFQKEGHMTDRLSKAVEQLGAEKKVDRIGRSLVIVRDELFDEPPERRPSKRTMIEWKGEPPKLDTDERVLETGEWKVFSETVPNFEVRIGAILSLERIAQDSTRHDQGRDHVRVMEILCAYIRHNAPASGALNHDMEKWEGLRANASKESSHEHEERRANRFPPRMQDQPVRAWARALPRPRQDIQIALDVLARRTAEQRAIEGAETNRMRKWDQLPKNSNNGPPGAWSGYRLDLRDTNLQGVRLDLGEFAGARLDRARLEGANLGGTRFNGARLHQTRLDGAAINDSDFRQSDLREATFEAVFAKGAKFDCSDLRNAKFPGAHLENSSFNESTFDRTLFECAKLTGASFIRAKVAKVDFKGAVLRQTCFSGAQLEDIRIDDETELTEILSEGLDLLRNGLAPTQ